MVAKVAGTAVAVRKNTLPVDWEKQMKADAAKGRQQEASVGMSRRLKTQGGILTYNDAPVPGNKMPVVVLYASKENALYEGEFDAANPSTPICFAFATQDTDEKDMVPHEGSPKKQHADCFTCPHNKFGTADKGRGKACKNQRSLTVIHADSLKAGKGGIANAEAVTASVPPTSLKGWAAHVKKIEELDGNPTYAYVTELALAPRQQGGFTMTFDVLNRVDKKLLSEVFLRAKAAEKEAAERPAYQPLEDAKGAPKGKGGKGKKRKY